MPCKGSVRRMRDIVVQMAHDRGQRPKAKDWNVNLRAT